MVIKGRHNLAKLTKEDVIIIQDMYSCGMTQKEIGRAFGVSHVAISLSLNRITWNYE